MQNRFRENIIFSSIYQIVTVITPLITSPFISRVLGSAGYGDYNYTLAFANFFFLFAMLGVNNYGNRSIASVRSDRHALSKTFWEIYSLQVISASVCILLYVSFCFVYPSASIRKLFILQGVVVAAAFTDINWFAFGLEKFKFTTIRNLIVKILTLIAIFVFIRTERDTWIYILIIEVGTVGGLFAVWSLVRRETDFVKPNLKDILKHLKPNFLLFIPVLATSVYQSTDKIMLGIFIDNTVVGFYSYAESILNVPLGLITAICTVSMPRITNLLSQDKGAEAKELLDRSLFFTTVLEIALVFGLAATANRFIPLYLGDEYVETAKLLVVLSSIVLLSGLANVIRMMLLIPRANDKLYVMSVIIGAVANIIGNFALMPNLGVIGACISTILAYLLVLIVQMIGSRKDVKYPKFLLSIVPFVLLGAMMYFTVSFIDKNLVLNDWILIVLEIVVGVLFYGAGTAVMMFVYGKVLKKIPLKY